MATTWPCDLLPTEAPSIDDALSRPGSFLPEDFAQPASPWQAPEVWQLETPWLGPRSGRVANLLEPVLACVPRGEAWGTDEAGDGRGASPTQLRFWHGIATSLAEIYRWAFEVATQAFPTAITFSLADWEAEMGLPDPCAPSGGTDERKAAVRARLVALGGASPGYFICVARAAGYDISIEEAAGFELGFGGSELGEGGGELTATDPESVWIVRPEGYQMDEFELGPGGGEMGAGGTRLVAYRGLDGLECLLRRISPVHTQLVFATA